MPGCPKVSFVNNPFMTVLTFRGTIYLVLVWDMFFIKKRTPEAEVRWSVPALAQRERRHDSLRHGTSWNGTMRARTISRATFKTRRLLGEVALIEKDERLSTCDNRVVHGIGFHASLCLLYTSDAADE